MAYADYSYYIDTFLGNSIANANDFDRYALRASSFMDYYTLGKVENKSSLDAVKMCCCALAEQYQLIETAREQSASGKELKSQSVGSWSQTYSTGGELEETARAGLSRIITEYLATTGLLYRGLHYHVPT